MNNFPKFIPQDPTRFIDIELSENGMKLIAKVNDAYAEGYSAGHQYLLTKVAQKWGWGAANQFSTEVSEGKWDSGS